MGHVHGRLIAFDLDGTLVDSRRDLADSANQLIEELGGTQLAEDDVGRMIGQGAAILVRRALEAAGLHDRPGALARFLDIYDRRLLDTTKPYAGILDAVHAARNVARTAVLTNKPTRATERLLDGLQLRALFDQVIGGDGVYPRKPDPTGLMSLMARARASSDRTMFVGDSPIDHETAKRADVRCCMARYGFGYSLLAAGRPADSDWTIDSAFELPAIFERFTVG
ncbi:MAG TPA: HAD-IA family hydrolase [Vicinamibacterales bacterium]|nr:HAD-IA family hydrolase [Vicinamibacterales bacterium]